MKENRDFAKIARQNIDMELFFTGDFSIKKGGKMANMPEIEPSLLQQEHKNPAADSNDVVTGLAEIAGQVKTCSRCEISHTRKNSVPGEGNPKARLVFVGEAPGGDEDIQGRPFVGKAGQLLDKIIAAMGLKRNEVFICNTLKCRPPENRDPRPDEIINCLPYLQRQLELINPQIIVALGSHAAHTLLDTNQPIGQLRGLFHDYLLTPLAKPIKLMPTYHPAYLLRNYSNENRKKVWLDMQKVLIELGLPVPQ